MSQQDAFLCYNHTLILLHKYSPGDGFCREINRNQLQSIDREIILEIQTTHLSRVYFSLDLTWLSCTLECIVTITVYLVLVNDRSFNFSPCFLPY